MVIMIASGLALTGCESFDEELPAAPREQVSTSVGAPSPQGTAPATSAPDEADRESLVQAGTSSGVPAAPYTSTPRYDSQFPDDWTSVQQDSADNEDLRRAEQEGLIVTDGAAMPSRPRQYADEAPVRGDLSSGYSDANVPTALAQQPPATTRPVTGPVSTGEPEIPEAPISTPSDDSRNVVPRRGSDGLPVYDAPRTEVARDQLPATLAATGDAARPTAGGRYGLHLASYRVLDNAYSGWDVLLGRHGEELGLLEPRIAAADIPGLGLHYRLKAGPLATREEAISLCERIKSAGDYCAVMAFDGEPL